MTEIGGSDFISRLWCYIYKTEIQLESREIMRAINSTTTKIQMVKGALSTREVVADYENCSDESHISKGQEFSAI